MKLRNKLSFVAFSALATVAASAAALLELDNESSLHAVGDVAFVWEDNVFRTSSLEESDMHIRFSPGLELRLSPKSVATTTISYRHHFTWYQDLDELDADFADLSLNFKYDSGIVLTNAYVRYLESYSNTYGIDDNNDLFGVLAERETTNIGANIRYDLSRLTAIKVGVDQSSVKYEQSRFIDHDTTEVPVTFFYKIRPKASLTAGARYRTIETDMDNKFEDLYLFVGGVGELFSPVIHADVSLGFQDRKAKNSLTSDAYHGSASYDVSLIYTGNPKTTVYGTLSRDYRTSAYNGFGYTFTSASLGARYSLSTAVGINASVAVGDSTYEGSVRTEDITMFNLGASYRANDYLMLKATYSYRDVDGNIANYKDSEFRVTASLRY